MTDTLDHLLRELHLPTMLAQAQTVAIEAERSGWSFTRYLYTLAALELEERHQRRVQRRRKESGLPANKTLTTLQMAHLPIPVRRQLPTLCEGSFVEQAQNVLAFGLPGRGKTHVLCAVGHALVERGYRVLFAPAYQLVQRLLAAKQALRLEQELHKLDGFAAIILDDIGYIQQSRAEMEVLFTFLAERYERKSVLISSNLVFSQWERIFQDPMTTAAAIDRLVHHAIILELTGPSFRTEQAQGRQQPAALTERDPSMDRDTPSNHLAPETVTELGGHSANVKK
ncbi:MAG: IS21-like element helper ATPase IstB [Candidatus Competibacteraceae bacterium]|nr:IS21-like element helper ATPase IstB [Candidatus Competibacteraceae bacterium]